jgi:hypothetical protein
MCACAGPNAIIAFLDIPSMWASRIPLRLLSRFLPSKNYYQVLGVPASSSAADIKKAYHDLARVLHPDAKTGSEARFKDIAEAFEVLGDEKIRQEYDTMRGKNSEKVNMQAGTTFKSTNFSKMSPEERKRRNRTQSNAKDFYQEPVFQDKTAWSGGHTRTGPSKYYAAEANKPLDAVSWAMASMAIGVLLGLVYWAGKALYAMTTLQNVKSEEALASPVAEFKPTRSAQRTELKKEPESPSIDPARTSRSKFPTEY